MVLWKGIQWYEYFSTPWMKVLFYFISNMEWNKTRDGTTWDVPERNPIPFWYRNWWVRNKATLDIFTWSWILAFLSVLLPYTWLTISRCLDVYHAVHNETQYQSGHVYCQLSIIIKSPVTTGRRRLQRSDECDHVTRFLMRWSILCSQQNTEMIPLLWRV